MLSCSECQSMLTIWVSQCQCPSNKSLTLSYVQENLYKSSGTRQLRCWPGVSGSFRLCLSRSWASVVLGSSVSWWCQRALEFVVSKDVDRMTQTWHRAERFVWWSSGVFSWQKVVKSCHFFGVTCKSQKPMGICRWRIQSCRKKQKENIPYITYKITEIYRSKTFAIGQKSQQDHHNRTQIAQIVARQPQLGT